MKCVWFLVAAFLYIICLTEASRQKCDAVKFGRGEYDKKRECWKRAPTRPHLGVSNKGQSLKIRRKIQRALKCRPGIQKFLAQKSSDCEPSKLSSIGLTNVCPSKFQYATMIHKGRGRKCYVVFPNRQCITYAYCKYSKGCAKNLKRKEKSACLPDRYRYFSVWVYCPHNHQFEYEILELPQCCTCRKYKSCSGGVILIDKTITKPSEKESSKPSNKKEE